MGSSLLYRKDLVVEDRHDNVKIGRRGIYQSYMIIIAVMVTT